MTYIVPVLVVVAMLGALGALLVGVISMARGGNPRRSNRLMQWRIAFQFVALLIFVVFMMLSRR